MKSGFFRDIFRGVYLGIISSSLLGYLVGLRILNWNPRLWSDVSNVVGGLLFTTILYAVFGLAMGIFFTLGLKLFLMLFRKAGQSDDFIRAWMIVFAILNTLLFIFLTITRTRPTAHVLIFDIPLVVIYCLSLILGFWIIYTRISRKRMGVLRSSVPPAAIFIVVGLAAAYLGTQKKAAPSLGDPNEIAEKTSSPNPDVKVYLFGIDGAEWGIIDELIEQGKMPVMEGLIERGARVRFESLPTLKSPLIWTSMATGKTPEKHGIEDFGSFQFPLMKTSFVKYPDGVGFYRLVYTLMRSADMPINSTIRRVEAVWNILSRADKTVGVVGWWATWPAEEVNGVMVSDRFTYTLFNPRASARGLTRGQVYPPEMLEEIIGYVRLPEDITSEELSKFIDGDVRGDIYPKQWGSTVYEEWNPLHQLKLGFTSGESFFNVSQHLITKGQPDFLTVYLEGNDMVSHYFWQYMDPSLYPEEIQDAEFQHFDKLIHHYYCYWDSLLGVALESLGAETDIIVASDHGFGPDSLPKTRYRGGEHLPFGVFLAAGPHFKEGYIAQDYSVLDLTPTLLYLYGLPVGEDMDGRVMEDVFTDEFLTAHPIEKIASYETDRRRASGSTASPVDEQIKDQLRSLGYTK